jgi:predicted protein tyrosine phosphatase
VPRVLFVCGKNRARSPTAEQVFADHPGLEVASAGVSRDADERVTPELIAWADVVCVMERAHLAKLKALGGSALRGKRVVNLRIPDVYGFMEAELVALVRERVDDALGRAIAAGTTAR